MKNQYIFVKSLKKRMLNFMVKIQISRKRALRNMLSVVRSDCRSTTGRNLRRLLLEQADNSRPYDEVPEIEKWKISFVRELIDGKTGTIETNMSYKQLEDICEYVSCS